MDTENKPIKETPTAKPVVATPSPAEAAPVVQPAATTALPPNKPAETNPKKSKRGCFVAIAFVAVVLLISGLQGLPFLGFGFLPWNNDSDIPIVIPLDSVTSDLADTPTAASNNQSTASMNSTSSNGSTTSKSSSPSSSSQDSSSSSSGSDNSTTDSTTGSTTTPTTPTVAVPQTVFTRQEQIDFFVQVAMKNDLDNFSVWPIIKWTSNSGTIRYYNNPSGANLACADETISLINGLSHTITFQKTTSNQFNIRVFFVPKSQLGSYGGYYNYSTGTNGQIIGGDAYVPIDGYNEVDRCHYIRHEMTHVMTGLSYNGLKNHGGYDFSIFNVTAGHDDYLEVDKAAIKIMLNSGVGLKWNESQVRSFLATATW